MIASICLACFSKLDAFAQNPAPAPIADNSFLIEEAYNQEAGVVQHINTFYWDWDNEVWDYSFTQEWPVFSQAHQFSYTIPVLRLDNDGLETDLGDIMLNYRYQAVNSDQLAVSPRFSLILPSGDEDKGFGAGVVGYELAAPLSVSLSDTLVSHWNLGLTITPDAEDGSGLSETTTNFFYGASLVYHYLPQFDALLEFKGTSEEIIGAGAEREDTFFINPGMRFALNFESGLQIVPGLGFPIGIGSSQGEYGIFFYLSLEHPY